MIVPMISGNLRPNRSASTPWVIWPTARPTNHAANVICAEPMGVCRPASIAGKAGRYMSVVSGPIAVRNPNRIGSHFAYAKFHLIA